MIQKGNLSVERESLYFEMIYEAIQRIELVVRDLAEHARQRDLHWEELDLRQLLDRCFRLIRDALERYAIAVQRDDGFDMGLFSIRPYGATQPAGLSVSKSPTLRYSTGVCQIATWVK
jgi:signal transduction histidine kinase